MAQTSEELADLRPSEPGGDSMQMKGKERKSGKG